MPTVFPELCLSCLAKSDFLEQSELFFCEVVVRIGVNIALKLHFFDRLEQLRCFQGEIASLHVKLPQRRHGLPEHFRILLEFAMDHRNKYVISPER